MEDKLEDEGKNGGHGGQMGPMEDGCEARYAQLEILLVTNIKNIWRK